MTRRSKPVKGENKRHVINNVSIGTHEISAHLPCRGGFKSVEARLHSTTSRSKRMSTSQVSAEYAENRRILNFALLR